MIGTTESIFFVDVIVDVHVVVDVDVVVVGFLNSCIPKTVDVYDLSFSDIP
jgi:hypothetical protein